MVSTPGHADPVFERRDLLHPDAQRLVEAVQGEYVARYGGRDDTPLDPSAFADPTGALYVGYLDGAPVVSGALRFRDDVEALGVRRTAEVKRMYVVPAARGQGLARRMLAHLESAAMEAGCAVVILETGERQPEAIALYTSAGYQTIPGFGFYRDSPLSRCFARRVVVGGP